MAIIQRTSRTATNNFRLNSSNWTGVPKPKFLYFIRLVRTKSSSSSTDWTKGLGILAHTVNRPGISFELQTLNQYNKKRLVQSKQEFEPLEVKFHDTVDQRAYHMFEDYYRYYYGEPNLSSPTDWSWDIMASSINKLGNWGFRGTKESPAYTNYFSHIEVYYVYGGKFSRIDYINPKIENIGFDELSMEDTGTLNVSVRFRHEGQLYRGNEQTLTGALISEMGLNAADFFDYNGGSAARSAPAQSFNFDSAIPNSFDPASVFSGGPSFAPPSLSNNRSDGLNGLNNSFNSVLNGLLSDSLGGSSDFLDEGNYANRLTDGLW